uniref:Kinesin family member 16B n=1 Tax=Cynoglossus semilaevis TaxID=244447 RepID=A0A3P8UM49_CYNSE
MASVRVAVRLPDGIAGDSIRDRVKTFTYDFSYDSGDSKSSTFVSQEKVFRDLGIDVLKAAFEGYNACVFAYGQTGSGKSYTMMGNPGDEGLIPRICEGLFSRISEATRWDEASFRTEVSYLEIYNERVRDLLRRKSTQTYNLRVREHPKDGPYVEDLSKHLVQNYSDVEELMEAGNLNRTTASTGMNDVSSRSHAIFTINFTQAKFDAEMPSETLSKIHLVDLAGSERADATGATGVRLKEGGNINKSLVTLGNVISALADMAQDGLNTNLKKKSVFVPYRDSVLTWLLKDSLGGNSKTIMIANISPADVNYGETLSTLRYANRAKNIINKPTINEDANVRLIRELRAEIARLKALLVQGNHIALLDSPTALSMEEKLHQNEARVLELTKEWTNKWNETQNILKEETLALRKEGIGVVLDSELPHLIGIDDDLLSTGIILYHLKEGQTYVGREDASMEQDIILHGLDLESEHCMFQNRNGKVTLLPLGGAQCSVNGVQVTAPTQLNQGAVILLGRTNMFRFNHPKEAAKLREKRKSGLLSTFSLSMTDLSKSCENLSTVMLYNPGLEFERQQREELEKLELKRYKLIKEMEAKQQSEKAELERLQQEVESQRKESEEVQQRILHQEESLRRRSQDIESRLQDFLAEKERFEEERRLETQGEELPWRQKQQNLQEEEALEELKKEREEQTVRLEAERRRLEEQEREQLSLVGRLEEQLREKQEVAATLLTREDARRLEDERRALAEIRGALLRAKEAGERTEDEDSSKDESRSAHARYTEFKVNQLRELSQLEEDLQQQSGRLEQEVVAERNSLQLLANAFTEKQQKLKEMQEEGAVDGPSVSQEEQLMKQAQQRLRAKEQQLSGLSEGVLPALTEEKQRVKEVLERSAAGGQDQDSRPELDNTLYQVEKELEDKEEKLKVHLQNAQQLLQLQETYEFTANVVRQEEKVRRKEKEILESREKQQREAMEQAVARLERRHSALRRSISTEPDADEQRLKSSAQGNQIGEEPDQQRSEFCNQTAATTANRGQPNPKPGCLLILEKDITVVSAGPVGTLTVSHHFNLSEIKTVQVGLAGQHLRLIGCSEDAVLAVFTHSTKLSQDFCKVLLEAVAPGKFSEDTEGQQLLCDDLMVLSLTWSSVLPDVVLDNSGLRLTSRFKRVLADLLYIVHGNMDALDRPSLADVRPLLYTSVRVVNLRRPQQDNICQFLLTDTHVVLLLEDGVFHPVPRGSTLNPVRPHFRVLQLRKRSNSRCLFVRQKDGCVVVDIRFPAFKRPSEEQQAAPGPTAAEEPVTCHGSRRWDSWKLCFGCTADAVTVVNQLSR